MTDYRQPSSPVSPDDPRVLTLIHRMVEMEAELRELLGENVDLVLDPTTGTPIFFRETQQALLQVQKELREANATLEQRVAARTRELQESEQRLRTQIENSPMAVVEWDKDFVVTRWTGMAESIFGWSAEEIVGKRIDKLAIIYEGDSSIVERTMARLTSGDTNHLVSANRNYTKDGRVRYCEWYNSILSDVNGQMLSVLSLVLDITDRVKAEEEREHLLSELERRAAEKEATLNSIADGLVIFDQAGRITYSNQAAGKIFGTAGVKQQSMEEMITQLQPATPEGAPYASTDLPFSRALRGERVFNDLLVVHLPAHVTKWLSASAAPIVTNDGTMLGVVLSFSDVTALHTLQEQMRIMLQVVSHDLRAPITIMHGHVELLRDMLNQQHMNGLFLESLDAIGRSERRMNMMIEDLVDVTRFEGGQLRLQQQPIILQAFLDDLLKRMETMITGNRVVTDLPDDLPAVYADYDRLDRIMMNLLTNALKYSDGPVYISAAPSDGMVTISIADQGRGIDPTDIPHLFQRFYRSKGQRKSEGIGLGLYITHMLVTAHGGRIWVESEPGKGSTFFFTLPEA